MMENAFWNEIGVNAGDLVNAARHTRTTANAKTVNGEVQIQALVDGKKVIITETSVRRALQLKDAEGTECLPNATIFEQLTLMGAKTTAWNEFRVLDLENTKISQAAEITKLKERVKKLERRNKSRTPRLKRLSRSAQVVSSEDEEVTLVDEAQGKNDDYLMFDIGVLV
ncbi:hypothetical protein Tco_1016149 [Tanacetum coccineum]|uniref:Uncharacterized protein n=1 Tax=Tanacetum coccineum TaxID=301880 RepID=A0ABQ5FNV1_9ASTR